MNTEKMSGYICFLLLLLSPVVIFPGLKDYANLPQTVFIQTAACLLLLVFALRALNDGEIRFSLNYVSFFIAVFLAWNFISLIWASNRYTGCIQTVHLTACSAVFFVISHDLDIKKGMYLLLVSMVLAAVGASIIGIGQDIFKWTWIPQVEPPAATFANRNMAAQFVALAVPSSLIFFFYFYSRCSNPILSAIFIIIFFILICFLFLSGSRAGLLAISVTLIIFNETLRYEAAEEDTLVRTPEIFFWDFRIVLKNILRRETLVKDTLIRIPAIFFQDLRIVCNKIRHHEAEANDVLIRNQAFFHVFRLWIVLFMLFLTLLLTGYLDNVSFLSNLVINNDKKKASLKVRSDVYKNSIAMVKEKPVLGFGKGNFKVFYPAFHQSISSDKVLSEKRQPHNTHNDFLQAFVETGVIGFFLFIGIFAAAIHMACKLMIFKLPPDTRLTIIGCSGTIICFLLLCMFSFPLERAIPPLILFSMLGILASLYNNETGRFYVVKMSKKAGMTVFILLLSISITLVYFNYRLLKSDYYFKIARQAEGAGAWHDAVRSGKISLDLNPFNTATWAALGRAYSNTGYFYESIQCLKHVHDIEPYDINVMVNLGHTYERAGDTINALKYFHQVLKIKPEIYKVLNNIGKIHLKEEKYDEAMVYFKKALEIDDEDSGLRANIGFIMYKKGEFKKAANELELSLLYNPDAIKVHKSLYVIYSQKLNMQEKADYHKAMYKKKISKIIKK